MTPPLSVCKSVCLFEPLPESKFFLSVLLLALVKRFGVSRMRDFSYNIFSLQATALIVGREIRLIGTANIGQMPGYTTLESLPGTETKKPLTIGYYQNVHFTSLEESKKYDLLRCPECEEDFGTKNLLEKHKKKYHVYVNILVDFADMQFEVSDRKSRIS